MTTEAVPKISTLIDVMTERLRDEFPAVPRAVIDGVIYDARAFTTTYMLDAFSYTSEVERLARAALQAHQGHPTDLPDLAADGYLAPWPAD